MEPDNNPNIVVKPPPLNSDQLNYLIWRYLQEAGYGDAAVKLQRDWKVEAESLPFAKHIKGQALVSLVQKGLRYHHLSLTVDENGHSSRQLKPSMFYFGPDSAQATVPSIAREPIIRSTEVPRPQSPLDSSIFVPKKRENDSIGPQELTPQPAKRGRKSTQTANGTNPRKVSTSNSNGDIPMTMEIDSVNGHPLLSRNARSPSTSDNAREETMANGHYLDVRMDEDADVTAPGITSIENANQDQVNNAMPSLVHTLTNGESVGIQVAPAKVANLGPSTTIEAVDGNARISKIMWRPGDPTTLVASGDNFCGAWNFASSQRQEGTAKPSYKELLRSNDANSVFAVAWEPSGAYLAVAMYSTNQAGQLHLFDGQELNLIETLPASQRAITSLRWLPTGYRLAAIAPFEDQTADQPQSSTIMLWDLSKMQFSSIPTSITVPELLLDVDTAHYGSDGVVFAAGANAVYYCRAVSTDLVREQKWSFAASSEDSWDFVRCSPHADDEVTVVVASADMSRIWLPAKDMIKHDAHNAPITGLEIRPRVFRDSTYGVSTTFATSSMDGSIKVWQADISDKRISALYRLSIEQAVPILTLSYSPDGFCLSGASYGNTQIWNAEHGYNLMASWQGSDSEWRGAALKDEDVMSAGGLSSINGDAGLMVADHSLAWDADSKKLAFGLASQVAVINFQR